MKVYLLWSYSSSCSKILNHYLFPLLERHYQTLCFALSRMPCHVKKSLALEHSYISSFTLEAHFVQWIIECFHIDDYLDIDSACLFCFLFFIKPQSLSCTILFEANFSLIVWHTEVMNRKKKTLLSQYIKKLIKKQMCHFNQIWICPCE